MSKHTPEYRTILQCKHELVRALDFDLGLLSHDLLAAGLINRSDFAYVRNEIDVEHQAFTFLELVANRVSLDPGYYLSFIQVLMKRRSDHQSILEILDKTYKENGGQQGVSDIAATGDVAMSQKWTVPLSIGAAVGAVVGAVGGGGAVGGVVGGAVGGAVGAVAVGAVAISGAISSSVASIIKSSSVSTMDLSSDLEKVDKSHFHVFEIPEDCVSLSNLIHRVMPTYDLASGYGYRQYVTGERIQPDEQILLLNKNGGLFKVCEARRSMIVGKEIKFAGTNWKHIFIRCKSKASVTPGSLFLYYNHQFAHTSDSLSEKESSKLISHYYYLLSTPNIVSLSYEEDDNGRDVLSVGVIDINAVTITVPKTIVYETPQKWMKIPVQIFQEGVIKALSGPCQGGCKIFTEGLDCCGTLGVNIEYRGQYRLLSAAHVLTKHNDHNKDKNVYIDGDIDPVAVVEDHIPVRVYNAKDADNPDRFTQDLAWAEIVAEQWSTKIKEIGVIRGIRTPQRKEMVQYYGAASLGVQNDILIRSTNAAMTVEVQGCGWVFYEDIIKLDTKYTSVEEGDSGSAMVTQDDKNVVGILMSGGEQNAYACKLES